MLNDKFIEILAKRSVRRGSQYCAYQEMYNALNKEDQKALDDAWAKNYPTNLIVQTLQTTQVIQLMILQIMLAIHLIMQLIVQVMYLLL